MPFLLFRVVTSYPLTINTPDITGILPGTKIVNPGDVFVANSEDPGILGLLNSSSIRLVSTSSQDMDTAGGVPTLDDNTQLQEFEFPSIEEAGTLYVDIAGGVGGEADGSFDRPFVTIQEAVDAAPSGYVIFIRPGTYTETITLQRNVAIVGADRERTYLIGNMSWAPTTSSDTLIPNPLFPDSFSDIIHLTHLIIQGTLTFDSSGYIDTDVGVGLELDDVNVNAVDITGRGDGFDIVTVTNCGFYAEGGGPNITLNSGDVFFVVYKAVVGAITAHGGFVQLQASLAVGQILCDTDASFFAVNSSFQDTVTLSQTGGFFNGFTNCEISYGIALNGTTGSYARRTSVIGSTSIASGHDADWLDCYFDAAPSGDGRLNQSKFNGSTTTSGGAGDKSIVFDVEMIDANYTVILSETGATSGVDVPSIKQKLPEGVTINDSTGGRTFDYIVLYNNT